MVETIPAPVEGTALLQELLEMDLPSQTDCISYLSSFGSMQMASAGIVIVGVLMLVFGWQMFKVLMVANALCIGGALGHLAGEYLGGQNMPAFCMLAGGVVLGAAALALMKGAASLMAAAAGAVMGAGAWHHVTRLARRPELGDQAWVGGLVGLVALGLLTFIAYRLIVLLVVSFEGAVLAVGGFLALLLHHNAMQDPPQVGLRAALTDRPHLMPLLILVPMAVGLVIQYAAMAKKARKKRKATESAG